MSNTKSGETKSLSERFLDNKQLIYVAGGLIAILGMTFYFSSKNKKLLGIIEELSQRIEDQEERIQKMETGLSTLNNSMMQLNQKMDNGTNSIVAHVNQLEQMIREKDASPRDRTEKERKGDRGDRGDKRAKRRNGTSPLSLVRTTNNSRDLRNPSEIWEDIKRNTTQTDRNSAAFLNLRTATSEDFRNISSEDEFSDASTKRKSRPGVDLSRNGVERVEPSQTVNERLRTTSESDNKRVQFNNNVNSKSFVVSEPINGKEPVKSEKLKTKTESESESEEIYEESGSDTNLDDDIQQELEELEETERNENLKKRE